MSLASVRCCGGPVARGVHETKSESDPRRRRTRCWAARDSRPSPRRRPAVRRRPTRTRSRSSAPRSPRQQVPLLLAAGQDGHELGEQATRRRARPRSRSTSPTSRPTKLEKQGVDLTEHTLSAKAENRVEAAAEGVFRPYSGKRQPPGGDPPDRRRPTRASPRSSPSARPSTARTSSRSNSPRARRRPRTAPSRRCCTCPTSTRASGSRPEMTRRLMHYYLDNYGKDKRIKKIVDSTELWFVLSANPDGYDYTFTGRRRPASGARTCGTSTATASITTGDGVDLNRNFAYKWGYDNEGSSPNPTSETYRGASPGLRARDQGARRLREAHRLHVRHQLPLRRRTAALRGRLAGGHADPGRRALQGARRYPGELGDPRLPPAGLLGAVHHQRRGGRPRGQRQRHGDVHPGDVDLPDRVEPRPERRLERGRLRRRSSPSRTTRS